MTTTRRPSVALWASALAAVILLLGLAYVGFVRTQTGQTIDDNAMVAAREFIGSDFARTSALSFLRYLPEVSAGLAAFAIVIAAVVRRSLHTPVVALLTAFAAASTTQILKEILPRPNLGVSEATMNSFPSGHTTVAAAAMIAIVLVSAPRWRPVVAALGGIFASLAASATYILGWHRPADVVGAVLVAAAWGLAGGFLILWREPGWNTWRRGDRDAPNGIWLGIPWVFAVVGLGTAVTIWAFMLRDPSTEIGGLVGWYVLAGLGMIVGATMAVFGAAGGLLTNQTRAGT